MTGEGSGQGIAVNRPPGWSALRSAAAQAKTVSVLIDRWIHPAKWRGETADGFTAWDRCEMYKAVCSHCAKVMIEYFGDQMSDLWQAEEHKGDGLGMYSALISRCQRRGPVAEAKAKKDYDDARQDVGTESRFETFEQFDARLRKLVRRHHQVRVFDKEFGYDEIGTTREVRRHYLQHTAKRYEPAVTRIRQEMETLAIEFSNEEIRTRLVNYQFEKSQKRPKLKEWHAPATGYRRASANSADVRVKGGGAANRSGGAGPDQRGQTVCRYYSKFGRCRFGNKCAFKHVRGSGNSRPSGNLAADQERLTKPELKYCAKHKVCFNCGKPGEFARDCQADASSRANWRQKLKSLVSASQEGQTASSASAHAVDGSTNNKNNNKMNNGGTLVEACEAGQWHMLPRVGAAAAQGQEGGPSGARLTGIIQRALEAQSRDGLSAAELTRVRSLMSQSGFTLRV